MDNAGVQKTFGHLLGARSSSLKVEAHRPVRRFGFRSRASRLRTLSLCVLLWLSLPLPSWAQAIIQTEQQIHKLTVIVVDDNGVPVISARITLARDETQIVLKGETDHAGRRELVTLSPGLYRLSVEKEGFYAARLDAVRVGETGELEIRLHHELEVRETIDVIYSPPAIDPDKTATSENLSFRKITNLPYPTTRDFRNVLPFIPGVLPDATGQVHINGSATHQIHDQLDGFNITHPANGRLELRVSPDALREISVQSSRYSAEYGKGSGGVLSLATGMGDDRFRFSATDFIPSFQTRRGVNLNGWTPRATVSGPLRKGRAWFFDALDGEYNLDIITELTAGADRNHAWRLNNLAKAQINLNQGNILTAGLLVNYFHADHAGLSRFNPLETTREQRQMAYLFTLKDQAYLAGGLLLELGFGVNQFRADERPLGNLPYVISPAGTSGNYFKTSEGVARRLQWRANLFLPSIRFSGRHEFKIGLGLDRITYEQLAERRMISIRRQDATLAREIAFSANPRFGRNNFEVNGFAQDRWAISDRWLVEGGLRLDWDEIIRRVLVSPRFASSYLLTRRGDTKIAFGVGLFYDATNLDFLTRPLGGQRFDQFYNRDGQTPRGAPVETSFQASERDLRAPRFLNWSAGLERRLPGAIYLRLEFIEKRGRQGFTFANQSANPSGQTKVRFELRNEQRDRYDGVSLTLRQTFKDSYEWFASYTRSSARSNAVFDFSLDNVLFSPQGGGPLPWDAPNRLISWGWLPLIKGFDLAYSLDWRSGYPFSLINQDQQLVSAPNARRFPVYFSLNLHAERRFRLAGFHWALRAGFNNVTNRRNAAEVNNNVDSPQFLTFGSTQGRTFVGRIRLLGRK